MNHTRKYHERLNAYLKVAHKERSIGVCRYGQGFLLTDNHILALVSDAYGVLDQWTKACKDGEREYKFYTDSTTAEEHTYDLSLSQVTNMRTRWQQYKESGPRETILDTRLLYDHPNEKRNYRMFTYPGPGNDMAHVWVDDALIAIWRDTYASLPYLSLGTFNGTKIQFASICLYGGADGEAVFSLMPGIDRKLEGILR